jgi:hypothetical protein
VLTRQISETIVRPGFLPRRHLRQRETVACSFTTITRPIRSRLSTITRDSDPAFWQPRQKRRDCVRREFLSAQKTIRSSPSLRAALANPVAQGRTLESFSISQSHKGLAPGANSHDDWTAAGRSYYRKENNSARTAHQADSAGKYREKVVPG